MGSEGVQFTRDRGPADLVMLGSEAEWKLLRGLGREQGWRTPRALQNVPALPVAPLRVDE